MNSSTPDLSIVPVLEDGSPNLPINVFDLSGFPHWETVSSNIWAYFINPNEQHGFGTLVLKSIMQAISGSTKCQIVNSTSHKLLKENSFIYETVSVEREMQTTGANNVEDRSRRIDIDVDSDNFKLIIENKIDALPSYNNLVAYAQHGIKELYSDNQTKPLFIGFLCQSITHKPSLKEQFQKLCQEFSHKQNINNIYYFVITYDEVFDNIKKNGFSFKNSNSLDSRSSSLLKQFRENTSLAYKESLIVEDLPLIKNNSKQLATATQSIKSFETGLIDFESDIDQLLEYIITEVKLKYPKLCGNNWGTKYPSNANAKQPFIHKIYRGNNDIAGFDCGTENGGKFAFEIFYDLDVVLHKKGFEAGKLYFKAWHHGSQDKVENRLFLGENEEFKSVNIKTAGWDGWGYELTSLDDLSKKEDIQDLVKKIGDILRNFDESKKG